MASIAQKARELAAEIILRDRTKEGADSAVRNLDRVADAAEQSATVTERTERVNASAARSYERLQRFLDPLATAQQRLERDQRTLQRAQEQGVITTDRYEANLRQLQAQFDRTKARIEQQEKAQRGLNQETGKFERVLGVAKGAVAGFFAAFSFQQITQGTRQAVADLDEIAKKARSLGGIGEAGFLQSSRFALGQLGFGEADVDKALSDLQRRIGQFKLGTGELGQIALRVEGGDEFAAALKNAKGLEEQFDVALAKLSEIEDESLRAALAGALFGEEAAKKIGALAEAGVEGVRKLRQEAEDAGLVVSDELLVRAEEINDRFSKAAQIVGVQLKQAFLEIAPLMVTLVEQAGKLVRLLGDAFGSIRRNTIDPKSITQIFDAEAQIAETNERITQTQARRDASAQSGRDTTALDLQLERLAARLADAEAKYAELVAMSVKSVSQVLEGIDPLGEHARKASQSVGDLGDAAKKAAEKQVENDFDRAYRAASDLARRTPGSITDQRADFEGAFESAFRQFQPDLDARALGREIARGNSEFSQSLLDEAEKQNETLKDIEKNTGGDRDDRQGLLTKLGELSEALIEPFNQVTAGFEQLDESIKRVGGSIVDKIGGIANGAANIFSGAGKGISKIFGDGAAGLSKTLGSLGSILGGVGAAASLVSSAVSFFKDLFGKTSNFTAQGVFNPTSGDIAGLGQDKGAEDNAKARDAFIDSVLELTKRLTAITGGAVANDPSTSANEAFLNVAFRSDRKTGEAYVDLGYQGANGEPFGGGRFSNVEEAIDEAVRLTIGALKDGSEELVNFAKGAAAQGASAERILSGLEAISDQFDQSADPLAARIDKILDAFAGLDRSSGLLAEAFLKSVERLSDSVAEETRRAIVADDNPQLAAIEDLLRQQEARRTEVARLEGLGGNVDASLLSEFQRRQILGEFNIETRFAEATDPARFAIEQLLENQRKERDAFRKAIEESGGLVGEDDFLGLLRAQRAERAQAFAGLSDEEKLRLADRADEFTDLTGQYALTVDRILEETQRLVDGFEEERARLQDVVATRGAEVAALDEAIRRLGDTGSARQSVERRRTELDDLANRAQFGNEDEKRAARAALPAAVDAYVQRLEEVFASGATRDAGVAYARDILTRVREQAAAEKTQAERQLETLEQSRDFLEEIRDLMAAPRLDIEALAKAAAGYDPDAPITALVLQLADLEARQTAQSERLAAVLEQIAATNVGLGGEPSENVFTGAAPASAFDGSAAPTASAGAGGASNSQTSTRDADIVAGLSEIAAAVDEQTTTIVDIETARRERDVRIENYLKTIATTRSTVLK